MIREEADRNGGNYSFDQYQKLISHLIVYQFHYWVVDEDGHTLARLADSDLPFDWKELPRPAQVDEMIDFEKPGLILNVYGKAVIRLQNDPARYLVVAPYRRMSLMRQYRDSVLVSSVYVILFASLCSGLLTVIYLRRKARKAQSVLTKIESGDLKARFPIHGDDEISLLGATFNRMADEIERLVTRLNLAEKARTELLSELAHDIRTPLASSKSILQSLVKYDERLNSQDRIEHVESVLHETEYLQKLVDSLFLLAQISEPKYSNDFQALDLVELLREEIDHVKDLGSTEAVAFEIKVNVPERPKTAVKGNRELLRRLVRNLLENARKHARSKVVFSISQVTGGQIEMMVEDDGPGFSQDAVKAFGTRPKSRMLGSGMSTAVSLGLGSVVVKSIAEAHGGKLSWGNRDVGAQGTGAYVKIMLPSA